MGAAIRASETPRQGRSFLKDCLVQGLIDSLSKDYEDKGHSQRPLPRDQTRGGRRDREEIAEPELSSKGRRLTKRVFKNETFGTDFEAIVADARYKYISAYLAPAETKRIRKASEKMTCRTRSTGS
jgi:hypothetical protein